MEADGCARDAGRDRRRPDELDDAIDALRGGGGPGARASRTGYEGCYVLLSDEGKVLVMTFWETDEAARAAPSAAASTRSRSRSSPTRLPRRRRGARCTTSSLADAPAAIG